MYRPKCDRCNKSATVNTQQVWKRYTIDNDGEYTLDKEWECEDSDHLCDEHEEEIYN